MMQGRRTTPPPTLAGARMGTRRRPAFPQPNVHLGEGSGRAVSIRPGFWGRRRFPLLASYQAVDAGRETSNTGQRDQASISLIPAKNVYPWAALPVYVGVQHVQESAVSADIQVSG